MSAIVDSMELRLKLIRTVKKSEQESWTIWKRTEADNTNWLDYKINLIDMLDELSNEMRSTKKRSSRKKVTS